MALSKEEIVRYEWQMLVPGFGHEGQEKLKAASVLVSRCGGVGSLVAYQLAAAGIGTIIVAHGGHVKPTDRHRQLFTTERSVGKRRIDTIVRKLHQVNPHVKIKSLGENISATNVSDLVQKADIVVDCAPLFNERYLLNAEAVRQEKPLVECAMYGLEAHITTILPRKNACLACLYPEAPPDWKRQFPVFGAVSGTIGCMGAMEVIKVLCKLGKPLYGRLLHCDLGSMHFKVVNTRRSPDCKVCG